jgi:transcriptional regulator with XRE-family HTH domain
MKVGMKEEVKGETWREEQQRITTILKTLQRVLGKTNRQLESALGVRFGYLSRLYRGCVELRLAHLLGLSAALGLRSDEFFRIAYPSRQLPPSPAVHELQDVFQILDAPGLPRRLPVEPDELHGLIDELIERFTFKKGEDAAGEKGR